VGNVQRGAAGAVDVIAGSGDVDGAAACRAEARAACRVDGEIAAGEVEGAGAGAAEIDAGAARRVDVERA
ncbi:hypothetical protein, partial [Proteus mirabilis]|uniref:hypothetical protein n=1 Tax=Proteus mirabilis TaxID=584 RepID=UPI00195397C0